MDPQKKQLYKHVKIACLIEFDINLSQHVKKHSGVY